MKRSQYSVLALYAVLVSMPAWANVVVQQVEADENGTAAGYVYASVNFGSSSSQYYDADTIVYGNPNSDTSISTLSGHASGVAGYIYGSSSVAGGSVTTVYAKNAGNFLGELNSQDSLGSGFAPTSIVNDIQTHNIRVTNHSYVGAFNSASDAGATVNSDRDATRRIDYVIKTTDVVFVAGAASNVSSNTNYSVSSYSPVVWSSYNTIAVSGSQSFSPLTSAAERVGKIHADLYYADAASFGTARVSGYAVGLIQKGQDMHSTNAQKGLVVKSVLMTGAIKESNWTRDLANNLSINYGAGTADYNRSYAILAAGEKHLLAATSNTISAANVTSYATTASSGWAYASTTPAANGKTAIILNAVDGISEFTATLNWYVSYTTSTQFGTTLIDTSSEIFPHLSLELCAATLNLDGTLSIGDAINTTTLTSAIADDNVQHLYANNLSLAAGYYALVVTNNTTDGDTSDYALSYSLTPAAVPEPLTLMMLSTGACAMLLRRKRR